MNKIHPAESPALREAVDTVFTPEEKQKLKENLIEEQIQQAQYLREHPEIENVLKIALAELVKKQPENCVEHFCRYLIDNDLQKVNELYEAQREDRQRRARKISQREEEERVKRAA